MIIECLTCHTKYNVDETKIPLTGVKVRCHKCQNVILIKKEPQITKPEVPPPPEVQKPLESEMPVPSQKPSEPMVKPKPGPMPTKEMSEEEKKWHERARRLAKALASDLLLYNQNKVEQGLQDGTLVQLLGSEIRRSWEYYCQQIPKHIVESTDYFKEQLNKVIGKGKEIFK